MPEAVCELTITSEPRVALLEVEPDVELVEGETLVEEISIDGMCGVY
jgi:mycofactocin precursor